MPAPVEPPELTTSTRSFIYELADESGQLAGELLYAAGALLGFSTTQLRLAVRRMVEAELVEVEGRGRKSSITLTDAGLEARLPDLVWTCAAYRSDAGLDPWDGQWHLAAFEIPETQRVARDALRGRLVEMFGAQLGGGLYVSPFAWEPWLRNVAEEHGVAGRLTTLRTDTLSHGGSERAEAIAESLWPMADLHRRYTSFVDRWTQIAKPAIVRGETNGHGDSDTAIDETLALKLVFEASAELESIMRVDAFLPPALLPAGFAGPAARLLHRELTARLAKRSAIGHTHLIASHRKAIDRALAGSGDEFWTWAMEQTIGRAA